MISRISAFRIAPLPPFPPAKKAVARPLPSVGYQYDLDGNLGRLIYPDGTVVEYTYTNLNQLYQVANAGPWLVEEINCHPHDVVAVEPNTPDFQMILIACSAC
jgi:hypothetical protein